eukprot:TRINITY_DN67355_c2_g1_i12.p1 TRINITY_DN67355_c2_g1~~TRINITY_DN67355_c2_g1_i12.p1  ORF type:complete len:219 (+),score=19.47 TRINITY_DN67355_c2_g1_i12:77-733(+)
MSTNDSRTRYFTPNEVGIHNTEDDCWVSALGKVLNLSPLIEKYRGHLTNPIVRAAGTDISHWFDADTGDIKKCIDPQTGLQRYLTPYGRFVHVPPSEVTTDLDNDYELPWWADENYIIGKITKKTRKIRIINTLTNQEAQLEVCCEETLNEILDRYLAYNAHAASYTWKYLGKGLDMKLTLDDNGIVDESEEFEKLQLPDDTYIPGIHVYFNDDLTVG